MFGLVKRLSRTEECPVDILRSKCGARVRDFDVEHIELLIAKAQAASEITTNFSIPQRSLINRFAINSEAINRALRNKPDKPLASASNKPYKRRLAPINRAAILGYYWVIIGLLLGY